MTPQSVAHFPAMRNQPTWIMYSDTYTFGYICMYRHRIIDYVQFGVHAKQSINDNKKSGFTFFSWAEFTKNREKNVNNFCCLLCGVSVWQTVTREFECVYVWVGVCVSVCMFECESALLLLLLLTSWPHTRIRLTARDHDKWLFAKLRIFAHERRWTESDMHPLPFLPVPSRSVRPLLAPLSHRQSGCRWCRQCAKQRPIQLN